MGHSVPDAPLPRTHVLRWRDGEQWYDTGDDNGNIVSEGRLRWAAMGS